MWAGDGGCMDLHDETHRKMGGGDNTSVLAWRDAKLAHKKMISRFLQSRSHLIFCLRAEEKIKFDKNQQGKTVITPAGWMPVCEKNFMYEMTVSFMLLDANPGIGKPIKLQEQHREFFTSNKPLDEEAGSKLAKWAAGGMPKEAAKAEPPTPKAEPTPQPHGVTWPWGQNKGKPLSQLDDKSLSWGVDKLNEDLNNHAKKQYAAQNRNLLDAILAEVDARKGGPDLELEAEGAG